tara:strand:- start:74 stop:316 length:243 start_codon:yes stop_codon:yes gene_type:complete
MTSKEARAKLDAILARMRADADEINEMHRSVVAKRNIFTGSRPYRDAKDAIQALGEIADITVKKLELLEAWEKTKTTKQK